MSVNFDLSDVSAWRRHLGLMPVPLRANEGTGYVLLNGARGSFYLDLPRVAEPTSEFRSNAWSTNVGHGVAVIGRDVRVQRWDRREPELFAVTAVSRDLEKFHRHLERDAPPADLSIVAHGIRTFRRLRQAFGEHFSSADVLLAYLFMLADAVDGASRSVDLWRWDLPERASAVANEISVDTWTAVADYLMAGRTLDDLRPDVQLMLRHASGALFQEAHHLAIFDTTGQMQLIPTAPRPVTIQRKPTSSSAHFTPASITRSVVERAFMTCGGFPNALTILDPACGSGEFLREGLRQLRLGGFVGSVRLIGFDISEAACAMARFSLAAERNTDDGHTSITTEVDIRCVDALTVDWPTDVDIILMNPPFGAWLDMSPETKQLVTQLLGDLARNRPDLAAPFLMRAASVMKDGAVIGSVVPASMLDGTSSAAIRAALGEMLNPTLIARLGSHQLFAGARVDAGLYIAKRTNDRKGVAIAVWADHREASTSGALRTLRRAATVDAFPVIRDGFNIYENPSIGHTSNSWAPRPYDAWKTTQLVRGLPTVGSLFDVHQGILTGANTVFLLTEDQFQRLPRDEQFAFRRAVVNESITGGRITSTSWVFYPYGGTLIESEQDLTTRLPTYYETMLRPQKARLVARQRKSMKNWWTLAEHRPKWQQKEQPKIVSTYFGDRGSFAWDDRGDIAVVQGYAWLARPRRSAPVNLTTHAWLAILAILNSRSFAQLLSAHSNNVGGGQWNLSKRFVSPIPVPDVLKLDAGLRDDVSRIGALIQDGGLAALSVEDHEELDELVNAAYGLPSGL
ncbi:MAG TPA: N-6 DNA methylase [Thermoanaerobaculia bacterium]|jgi:predicted RNA methylase|nr:N-6 DNA methylase [Thermoanaerobaculia bacterium]